MSKETELVLVETVSMFRMRYMVEVPKGKSEWALDTVVMQEAKEFSQKHLDETIVSHRVVSKKEALELCDQDNDYLTTWSKTEKVDSFFTPWKEEDEHA
jgi:isopentenyldiphosphate isomerase